MRVSMVLCRFPCVTKLKQMGENYTAILKGGVLEEEHVFRVKRNLGQLVGRTTEETAG